jgi:hypothetical protein
MARRYPTTGEHTAHGQTAVLHRIKPGVFNLRLGQRVRWGTAKEILEDLEHFREHGSLPRPAGPRW